MTSTKASSDVWTKIEHEQRRDRSIRILSVASWAFTLGVLAVFATITGIQIVLTMKAVSRGALPQTALLSVVQPFVITVGVLSVLIATLSTVGVFLRLRTASLTEIQVRLAALEEFLQSQQSSTSR